MANHIWGGVHAGQIEARAGEWLDTRFAYFPPNYIEASEAWRWWRAMSRLLMIAIPLALLGLVWSWRRRIDRTA